MNTPLVPVLLVEHVEAHRLVDIKQVENQRCKSDIPQLDVLIGAVKSNLLVIYQAFHHQHFLPFPFSF